MSRLSIVIEAPSDGEVQEGLDDVVAAVAAGQIRGVVDEGTVRIRFDWQGQGPDESEPPRA